MLDKFITRDTFENLAGADAFQRGEAYFSGSFAIPANKPGRVRIAYLSQMPDNSVALQIRIFANFLSMAVMVAVGWYAINILLLLNVQTEAEINIIEGKIP